jgi:NADH-quinone oxidoreductase subunit M
VDLMRVLLLGLLVVPAVAAVVVALLGARRLDAIRWVSLGATLATAVVAAVLAVHFAQLRARAEEPAAPQRPAFRPEIVPGDPGDTHATAWNLVLLGRSSNGEVAAMQFYVGLDGLNVWLVVLTAVLLVSGVLISWTSIQERVNEYYAWLLVLETGMIGVFLSFDIILFYVFFELTLVPLFFLIGIWGGPERRYAARKFFIYTLAGSLITLLGVLGVVIACQVKSGELTFSIPRLVDIVQTRLALEDPAERAFWRATPDLSLSGLIQWMRAPPQDAAALARTIWGGVEFWVFLALMVGFAIKVPLVPLHTWLPLAHVEAPTAGSVLLAGVLLKIGAYGFLRLCLPLAPDASLALGAPLIGALAAIGVIYGALCALAQDDIKKLVAYSSVSHLGLCMIGMFALNRAGIAGSLMQMINHGLSTGALFLLVGMLYERYHTRKMADYGGLGARLHLLAIAWVFICLTSVGLPGLNGFVGEVLVLMGAFDFRALQVEGQVLAIVLAVVIGILTLLAAAYMGTLLQRESGGSVAVYAVPLGIAVIGVLLILVEWRLFSELAPTLPLGPVLGVAGAAGIVLGAWYLLTLLLRVFFGPVKEPEHDSGDGHPVRDLGWREFFALAPIALLCVAIGVYPQPVLDAARPDVEVVARIADRARDLRRQEPPTPTPEAAAPNQPHAEVTR